MSKARPLGQKITLAKFLTELGEISETRLWWWFILIMILVWR